MSSLPVDQVLPDLLAVLAEHHHCILQAEPGAGKTTRVPLALLEQNYLSGQKIIMLEPRRIAARGAAEFMAEQLGERCGETIGFRIRDASCVSSRTRLEVVTEGVFLKILQDDPSLEGVGLVVFDEFHERNLDSDVALALCLQANELFREDSPCRLLVMSATLNIDPLVRFLNCPVIKSEGRSYPVELVYAKEQVERKNLIERLDLLIRQLVNEEHGSILVFLPGQAEIKALESLLLSRFGGDQNLIIASLYGQLGMTEQRQAVKSAPAGKRKIVLATNIAESSITIEGVTLVIDSGWVRVAKFDPRNGMSRLHNQRVSQASATQRAGRAGRTAPGRCFRLWTEQQHVQLPRHDEAEIHQADLAATVLQLLAWGCQSPDELAWLDAPPRATFEQARDLLIELKAIEHGVLTAHGSAMSNLPLHPRLGHMLLRGAQWGAARKAAMLAVLLEEKDPLQGVGADLEKRLRWLEAGTRASEKFMLRVEKLLRCIKQEAGYDSVSSGELLALAYPDRVAQRRAKGRGDYKLASGRGATLATQDDLFDQPYLVVADVGGRAGNASDTIFSALTLPETAFENSLVDGVVYRETARLDRTTGRFEAKRERCWGELVLSSEPLQNIDSEIVVQALLDYVAIQGVGVFAWSDQVRQWQARATFCSRLAEGAGWPDFSDSGLQASLAEWLPPFLQGCKSVADLKKIDLLSVLQSRLVWSQQQWMEKMAPASITVPTGRSARIDYSADQPVLAIRLQEMFGCPASPSIAEGRVRVVLHLLSPAQRPLAVTSDLESFWQNAYHDVKKDMKGRYPKHYWPEDPLKAQPTQVTKARMNESH